MGGCAVRPYSHAVEVPEGSRLLYISGEVGVLPDGTMPDTIEAQAEACWRNVIAILGDAEMGVQDLVKITTYLVRRCGRCRRSTGQALRRCAPGIGDDHSQGASQSVVADRN